MDATTSVDSKNHLSIFTVESVSESTQHQPSAKSSIDPLNGLTSAVSNLDKLTPLASTENDKDDGYKKCRQASDSGNLQCKELPLQRTERNDVVVSQSHITRSILSAVNSEQSNSICFLTAKVPSIACPSAVFDSVVSSPQKMSTAESNPPCLADHSVHQTKDHSQLTELKPNLRPKSDGRSPPQHYTYDEFMYLHSSSEYISEHQLDNTPTLFPPNVFTPGVQYRSGYQNYQNNMYRPQRRVSDMNRNNYGYSMNRRRMNNNNSTVGGRHLVGAHLFNQSNHSFRGPRFFTQSRMNERRPNEIGIQQHSSTGFEQDKFDSHPFATKNSS